MKPPSENHDLIRWLDGEMSDIERISFETRMKDDPAMSREAAELKAISGHLRIHLPAEMKVPYEDFFNSQVQVRIAQVDRRDRPGAPDSLLSSVIGWVRKPWFAGAIATALILLGFTFFGSADVGSDSLILSSYTPNARVQARTFHDDSAQATILMLDGLDEIPADRKVSGLNVHHSGGGADVAETTLFDANGARLLMISRDAAGNPTFQEMNPRG